MTALIAVFSQVASADKGPAVLASPAWPLIVTHASSVFDGAEGIKRDLDLLIQRFKFEKRPVIYLINGDGFLNPEWETEDRSPTLALASRSGELSLDLRSDEITVAGGFFELCEAQTVWDAASFHFKRSPLPFTVHYPMGATYTEKYAYRMPGAELFLLPEILGIGHNPTLREAWQVLGPDRFAQALLTGLQLLRDHFAVRVEVDGIPKTSAGEGPQLLVLKFES